MFQVQTLSKEDIAFAVDLANTMDWNMAVEDFEFMASLEPNGCFLLTEKSRRVGVATCISYGRVGWFGNLIVQKEYRHRGAGSLLVKHAISYLQSRGVESVGLYCEPPLTNFYSKLGFKKDDGFIYLHGKNRQLGRKADLFRIEKQNITQINGFDSQFFGGDRQKLLESIILNEGNLGYYMSEDGRVVGYIAATVYETAAWIGPLVCEPSRYDIALPLVETALAQTDGKTVFAALPKKDTQLSKVFSRLQNVSGFSLTRMFYDQPAAKNCIYMAESLERG